MIEIRPCTLNYTGTRNLSYSDFLFTLTYTTATTKAKCYSSKLRRIKFEFAWHPLNLKSHLSHDFKVKVREQRIPE